MTSRSYGCDVPILAKSRTYPDNLFNGIALHRQGYISCDGMELIVWTDVHQLSMFCRTAFSLVARLKEMLCLQELHSSDVCATCRACVEEQGKLHGIERRQFTSDHIYSLLSISESTFVVLQLHFDPGTVASMPSGVV